MIWDWLVKFIGYFSDGVGPATFEDGLGEGAFGWRHFLWIALVIAIAILGYQYFQKHPTKEPKWVGVLLVMMFLTRFTHQTVRAFIGAENPWTQAFPFHMCTVLTFLLPLTVLFDWKAIKTPVYVLSIMGGTITMLMGDYFGSRFMNFFTLEGMAAHSILILIPIFEIAAGRYRLELRDSWKVFAGILVLMGWATLANLVFYPGLDPNYMYLMENALPFGNDQNFFAFYVLIFFSFFSIIYGFPAWIRSLKKIKNLDSASIASEN